MTNPVISLLRARRSSRAIRSKALPESIVEELIEAARMTPSCYNNQPWRFLFLESAEGLEKGIEALAPGNAEWAKHAPLLIIGYSREEDDCVIEDGRAYHQFDLGMASMNMMLAATHHDLTARPMAGFDPVKICESFGLRDEDEPFVVIAVGEVDDDESMVPERYKGIEQKTRVRKPAEETVNRR